jgi:hypothetical protein
VWANRLDYNQQTVSSQESSLEFDVLDETGDILFDGALESFEDPGAAGDADTNGEASPPADQVPPANEAPPVQEATPANKAPTANKTTPTNEASIAKDAPPANGTSLAKGTPPGDGTSTANGTPDAQDDDPFARHSRHMLQRKIERTFGEEGTVSLQKLIVQHSEQTDALMAKHRGDLEQQQQVYLDQIRGCRDEIQKLKSELRHEQARSQRLQQLLRGELP